VAIFLDLASPYDALEVEYVIGSLGLNIGMALCVNLIIVPRWQFYIFSADA
jgi:hypothetical protein